MLMLGATFLVATCARAPAAQTESSVLPPDSALHHIKTVFVIMMENHNWSNDYSTTKVEGNPLAPYINYTLIPEASHANNYWNPPHNHPSLPNYLWLEAGTNFGITKDGSALKDHQSTHEHLTAFLTKANISWRSYDEGSTGTSCPLDHWHDPFVFFNDNTNGNDRHSAKCIAHVRPFGQLNKDLADDKVARYNFIVPSECHDMHNICNGGNRIAEGDKWLSEEVPHILNSTAYRSGGALFIIWDEARKGDGPIPMIVLSPFAKGNGYSNHIHYTHGSALRTFQEIFGVYPLMRDAAHEKDLRDLFSVFP